MIRQETGDGRQNGESRRVFSFSVVPLAAWPTTLKIAVSCKL